MNFEIIIWNKNNNTLLYKKKENNNFEMENKLNVDDEINKKFCYWYKWIFKFFEDLFLKVIN